MNQFKLRSSSKNTAPCRKRYKAMLPSLLLFGLTASVSDARTFGNDDQPWLLSESDSVRIEAENYDRGGNGGAYFDNTLDNLGGEYRLTGPDIQRTSDCNGGLNIGWFTSGEYLQYTVDAPVAGTYTLTLRTARQPAGNASVDVYVGPRAGSAIGDDVDERLAAQFLKIKSTNDWQVWRSDSQVIELDQGVQTLQFEATGGPGFSHNFNYFTLRLKQASEQAPNQAQPLDEATDVLHDDIVEVLELAEADILRSPSPSWADSYSVGDQCYCMTTFDHNIGDILVDGPDGVIDVREACARLGDGPGSAGRPLYNDIQCGNGPANDAGDEDWCPGRVDQGKIGCAKIGPAWKFD